jgi:hypothetical protein
MPFALASAISASVGIIAGAFAALAGLVAGAVAAAWPSITPGAIPPTIAATNTRESPRIVLPFRSYKNCPLGGADEYTRFEAHMATRPMKIEDHL